MSNVSIAGYAGWPTYDMFLIVSLSVYDQNPLRPNLNPQKTCVGFMSCSHVRWNIYTPKLREEERQPFRHWDPHWNHSQIISTSNPTMNPTVAELSLTISASRSSSKSSTLSIFDLSMEEERGKKRKKRKREELKRKIERMCSSYSATRRRWE